LTDLKNGVIIVYKLKKGKNTMQNYNNTVAAVIQHYASQIANSAQDSINENNDYCIIDNCAKMEFLFLNSADYATVPQLASACLNSKMDTAVRECMYNSLMYSQ
jgi:hypothetical protein|tara:strand:+ start:118 stop:429 length:312 start_codon:yes stop_codon:yes gene_type:complete